MLGLTQMELRIKSLQADLKILQRIKVFSNLRHLLDFLLGAEDNTERRAWLEQSSTLLEFT